MCYLYGRLGKTRFRDLESWQFEGTLLVALSICLLLSLASQLVVACVDTSSRSSQLIRIRIWIGLTKVGPALAVEYSHVLVFVRRRVKDSDVVPSTRTWVIKETFMIDYH
ncbi:hypothetical protein EDB84DRAFT_1453459 [Lactarius hengduanensis]|nr:hypothetical protein EDB84DRAFT_1453459 [Lactarius hengduanensis]